MAYRNFQPQDPKFRKITKNRTKQIDEMSKELKAAKEYNPWVSMYSAEYSNVDRKKQMKKGPPPISYKKYSNWQNAPTGAKQNNFMGTNDHNLNELNDAVSVQTWEVRGEPVQRTKEYNYSKVQKQKDFARKSGNNKGAQGEAFKENNNNFMFDSMNPPVQNANQS